MKFITHQPDDIYQNRAYLIQKELGVRYIIIGHTHEVDLAVLNHDGKVEYSNSGTWTKILLTQQKQRVILQW